MSRRIELELRRRMHRLLEHHSQAEISRRTGIPASSLSKYVSGQRIPADVCVKLVTDLGVNPAWLLTGDGPVFVADLAADSNELTGSLLRIVRSARAAAESVKELSTDTTRSLGELADLIEGYQASQSALDQVVEVLLQDLVDQFRASIDVGDFALAEEQDRLCSYLCQLVRDPALKLIALDVRAILQSVWGDSEAALETRRQIFAQSLALNSEPACQARVRYVNLIISLRACGYLKEALRTASTLIELHRESDPQLFWSLVFSRGVLHVDSGDVEKGLASIVRALPELSEEMAQLNEYYVNYALVMQGAVTLERALQSEIDRVQDFVMRRRVPMAYSFLLASIALESETCFRRIFDEYQQDLIQQCSPHDALLVYGSYLRRAFEHPTDTTIVDEYFEHLENDKGARPLVRCESLILATQLARLTKHARALESFEQAEQARHQLAEHQQERLLLRFVHFRNGIDLVTENESALTELRRHCADELDRYCRLGYRIASDLTTSPVHPPRAV